MCRIQLPFFAFIIAILNISMGKSLYIYTVQHFYLDKWLEMELLSQMVCKILMFLVFTAKTFLREI